ncbi:hypothetical protein D1AOALGA4SA_625 [Olavius algarvensis Delta 1 endosymbiont]|nr:hypothetical protein D1AOALGA4SA_625 [Olavius algarvensis Delta 1 endosymbiont]
MTEVERFRFPGFKVQGLGFRVQGSKVQGSKVQRLNRFPIFHLPLIFNIPIY